MTRQTHMILFAFLGCLALFLGVTRIQSAARATAVDCASVDCVENPPIEVQDASSSAAENRDSVTSVSSEPARETQQTSSAVNDKSNLDDKADQTTSASSTSDDNPEAGSPSSSSSSSSSSPSAVSVSSSSAAAGVIWHFGSSVNSSSSSGNEDGNDASEQSSSKPSMFDAAGMVQLAPAPAMPSMTITPNAGLQLLTDDRMEQFVHSVVIPTSVMNAPNITVTMAGLDFSLPSNPATPVAAGQMVSALSLLSGKSEILENAQEGAPSVYPTRAAMIDAVLREFDVPLIKRRAPFKDVAPTNPYTDAIATAKQLRLITGDTDENAVQLKTFRPNDPVNTAEMHLIIRRLLRLGFVKKF